MSLEIVVRFSRSGSRPPHHGSRGPSGGQAQQSQRGAEGAAAAPGPRPHRGARTLRQGANPGESRPCQGGWGLRIF